MKLRTVALTLLLAMAVVACGGSDGDSVEASADASSAPAASSDNDAGSDAETEGAPDTTTAEELVEDAAENAEDFADDLVDSLEDAQAAQGGGSATLTVGDETWTFSPVLCAFGPEEIGQEGAEFVLSSIQDGKQMYFSIDSFGHSVSLDDVEDFENPSVSVGAFGGGDFIMIDGKSFSGSADFLDNTSDSFETIPGTFSGTCP